MFTEKHYLDSISRRQLDAHLAKGWYRMGQAIFTCSFLVFDSQLYSVIWIRLPLQEYRFRKSLRKIYNRNQKDFRIEQGPANLNLEKEALYQRYRRSFSGRLAPTLRTSLLDDTEYNIFETNEFRIYDGDQLIGFSFFDRGEHSLASIMGVYDPNYDKNSLGFFTMLLEIEWGIQNGLDYYYPGYIVPGYSRFDYKLRIGQEVEVEAFLEKDQTWVSYAAQKADPLPNKVMEEALKEIQDELRRQKIQTRLLLYPPYEANLLGYWILDYLEYPLILQCHLETKNPIRLILVYDFSLLLYRLFYCTTYDDLSDFFVCAPLPQHSEIQLQLELLIKEELVAETASKEQMMEIIAEHQRGLGSPLPF